MDEFAKSANAYGDTPVNTLHRATGGDLGQSERVLRVPWPAPVANPEGVRAALIALARAARGS